MLTQGIRVSFSPNSQLANSPFEIPSTQPVKLRGRGGERERDSIDLEVITQSKCVCVSEFI